MRLLTPAILAIFALGCMDREEEYTLNPDGSGKAVISWVAAPFDPFGMSGKEPDAIMKKIVRSALSEIPGIDCWKDVTFSMRPDGKIAFKGTAYFKDFNALAAGRERINFLNLNMKKDDKGNLILSDTGAKPSEEPKEKPGDDQLKKDMLRHRFRYQQTRPALRGLLTDYKLRLKVKLPGAVGETQGFAKADGAVTLVVDGPALFKVFEDLYLVDENLKKAVLEGADLEIEQQSIPWRVIEDLYKSKDLRAATTGDAKPAFDYDAEVTEKVREDYKALLASLPADPRFARGGPPADPTPKKPLEDVLRENLSLDLAATPALRLLKSPDEFKEVFDGQEYGVMSFEIRAPGYSRSSGGNDQRFLRLKLGQDSIERMEYRLDAEFVTIKQGGGLLRVSYDNETTGASALLHRTSTGFQVVMLNVGETFTGRWTTLAEAAKSHPVELAPLMNCLRRSPVSMAMNAADPSVAAMALRWPERPNDAVRKLLDDLLKELLDESLEVRERATGDLKREVKRDVVRIRHLVGAQEASKDGDVRNRIQAVLAAYPDEVGGIRLVKEAQLHRDLAYLGALLADPRNVALANPRFKALVGREFETRKEFDAWHAANKDKLKWDAEAGKYKTGP